MLSLLLHYLMVERQVRLIFFFFLKKIVGDLYTIKGFFDSMLKESEIFSFPFMVANQCLKFSLPSLN